MDGLGDFEGVVLGEEVDGGLDLGVFENLGRDLVQGSRRSSRCGYMESIDVS